MLKLFSLLVYLYLITIGLLANSNDDNFLKQLRNTNLGNLLVWSFWWAGIVIVSIFFGRLWCMVCPVELITSFFAKFGWQRKRPKWILSGWAITLSYIVILFVGIQQFAIHRNPFYMAIYLISIVSVSVIVGAIYEKNTFCRYFCPVGYLMGLYSRLSFLGMRVKDPDVCRTCKDKSCVHKNFRYNLSEKSCGLDLYPGKLDDNSACILCAGCIKACEKYRSVDSAERPNPALRYIGFANDLFKIRPLKFVEMVFVMIVSGFVISEIWSEWDVSNKYLEAFPNFVVGLFPIQNKTFGTFIGSIVLFLVIPFFIWAIPFLISRILGLRLTWRDYLLRFGLAFVPIVAAAHFDKGILKITSRLPYLGLSLSDPVGISTAQQIIDKQITVGTNPVWLNYAVSVLITASILMGIALSIKVVRLNTGALEVKSPGAIAFYIIPALYGGIFLLMLIAWRWIY
jgi:hypothetical protein